MDQMLASPPTKHCAQETSAHPLALTLLPLLTLHLTELVREHLIVAGCDGQQRLLSFIDLPGHDGTLSRILPALRRAMAPEQVSLLLIAHNHPCGTLAASKADLEATRRISALARLAGVTLADHLIFAGSRCTSFRAQGLL